MKLRIQGRCLRICFRIFCLVATGALFVRGGWKYWENESSSLVSFRTFQKTKRDIYPTMSLCMWTFVRENMLGIYDRRKLNETYDIHDPWEYIKFLEGDTWEEKLVGVKYDDITFDVRHRIDAIEVYGMNYQLLYRWARNYNITGGTEPNSDLPSISTQALPMYTSYRSAYGKCVSLDLSVDDSLTLAVFFGSAKLTMLESTTAPDLAM